MNNYGLYGKFSTRKGKRDELVAVLLQASKLVSTAEGCQLYVVFKDITDEDGVCVTEIWDSKEDHDNSLKIEGCKELISRATTLLAGKPEGTSLEVMGGTGLKYREADGSSC